MKKHWTREDIISLDAAHRVFRDAMHNGHRGSLDAVLDAVVRGLNSRIDDGELFTTAEAAAATGVHETSIRRWCRNGRIPGARFVGNQWRVTADGLAAAGLTVDLPRTRDDETEQGTLPYETEPDTLPDGLDTAVESAVTAALGAVFAALGDSINTQRSMK